MLWRLIKSIGKSIDVKYRQYFLQKYRYWYRQYIQRKLLVSLLAILFTSIVNKPAYTRHTVTQCIYITWQQAYFIGSGHRTRFQFAPSLAQSLVVNDFKSAQRDKHCMRYMIVIKHTLH